MCLRQRIRNPFTQKNRNNPNNNHHKNLNSNDMTDRIVPVWSMLEADRHSCTNLAYQVIRQIFSYYSSYYSKLLE